MTRLQFLFSPLVCFFRPKWRKCPLHCVVTNGLVRVGMLDIYQGNVSDYLLKQIKEDLKIENPHRSQ